MQTVKRLADLCVEALVDQTAEPESLYQLLTVELVDLSSRLRTECRAAREDCRATKEKVLELQSIPRYFVDPPRYQDRWNREIEDRQLSICCKWEVTDDEYDEPYPWDSETGNRLVPAWDWEQKRVYYAPQSSLDCRDSLEFCFPSLISSSLLLYRLLCIFRMSKVQRGNNNWSVWMYWLKHRETGLCVGFTEHRGAAMAYGRDPPTPASFDSDWLDLLNLLLDPMCSHPDDRTVAGSVCFKEFPQPSMC